MVGELLSYKMCAFAPRHAASAANRHKGGLGSPPKMLHESSSTKSWQFMAVNHSVYLVLGWAMLLHGYSAMALRTSLFKKREIPRSWTHFSSRTPMIGDRVRIFNLGMKSLFKKTHA